MRCASGGSKALELVDTSDTARSMSRDAQDTDAGTGISTHTPDLHAGVSGCSTGGAGVDTSTFAGNAARFRIRRASTQSLT